MITGTVGNITGLDIGIVILYFLIVLGFGLWSSLKNRGSVGGYFLAGRSMNFILVGASLFSSNLGSGHFIGLAGSGATNGIAAAIFEFNAMLVLLVLGWIFMPVYMASGIYTMPEYVCKRFGGQRIRVYLAILALLLSILTKISADLYAGALFINLAIDWDIYSSIFILVVISALFTITGGLTAVMWTDFIQTIVMMAGALYLMFISFSEIGGYNNLMKLYLKSGYLKQSSTLSPNTTPFHPIPQTPVIGHIPTTVDLSSNFTTYLTDHATSTTTTIYNQTTTSTTTSHTENLLLNLIFNLSNSTNTSLASSYNQSFPSFSSIHPTPQQTTESIPTTIDIVSIFSQSLILNTHVDSKNSTKCIYPPSDSLHLFRGLQNEVFPWPGIFAVTVMSLWYWCSDQVIVQRGLSSKNLSQVKAGCLLAGYLKLLPFFCIVLPGMIARILFPEIACYTPEDCMKVCNSKIGCSNLAYPKLVLHLMPSGSRGVMLSVIMSALMSSLSSVFNSSSTVFTIDIWKRLRKNCSETELMIVGRVFVLFMVGVSIAWIPIVQNFSELFSYIQSVTSYLAPPISAVYILAISCSRVNEFGAFWGLMVGLLIGMVRFVWENIYPQTSCGAELTQPMPPILARVHYLYFGAGLFVVVAVVVVVLSFCKPKINEKHLQRLLFSNRYSRKPRADLDKVVRAREEDTITMTSTVSSIVKQPSIVTPSSIFSFDEPEETIGCCMKIAKWICGIENIIQLSADEKRRLEVKHTSLEEGKTFYRVNNFLAILLIIICLVVTGLYA